MHNNVTLVKVNTQPNNSSKSIETFVNLNNLARVKPSELGDNLTTVEFDNKDDNFIMKEPLDKCAEIINREVKLGNIKTTDWVKRTLSAKEYAELPQVIEMKKRIHDTREHFMRRMTGL